MKKKLLNTFLILCMVQTIFMEKTSALNQVNAANRVKLNHKTITLERGTTKTIKLTGTKTRPKWSSKNKKIVSIKRTGKMTAKITAKKKGSTYIYAKVNKKTYRCKVKVKNPSNSKHTFSEQDKNTTTENIPDPSTQVTESPGTDTSNADAGDYSITKIHTGDGTYYDGGYTGGCCNIDAIAADYYVAAINKIDYRAGQLAGAYLKVTGPHGSIHVLITDTLADGEGKHGDIDLNKKAFEKIEPLVTGRMPIRWQIVPLPTKAPIQYVYKPQSTPYWMQVQVRNHRYPIKKLEYKDTSGKFIELPREEYNYFTLNNPGNGPFTFRVTDIYGHVLIDQNIPLNPSTAINGAANFPY